MERAFINRYKIDQGIEEDDFPILTKNFAPLYDKALPPSPTAQVWHRGMSSVETIVLGKRQGSSPLITKKTRSLLCDTSLNELANGYHSGDYRMEKEKLFKESKIFSHWPFYK